MDGWMDRQTDRWIAMKDREADRRADIQRDRQTGTQEDKKTGRQTDGRMDRQDLFMAKLRH